MAGAEAERGGCHTAKCTNEECIVRVCRSSREHSHCPAASRRSTERHRLRVPVARAGRRRSVGRAFRPRAARGRPRGAPRRCRARRRRRAWQSARWRRPRRDNRRSTRAARRATARRRPAAPCDRADRRRGGARRGGRAPTAGCRSADPCRTRASSSSPSRTRVSRSSRSRLASRRQLSRSICGLSRGGFAPADPERPITRSASSRCWPALKPPATRCQRISHSTWHCTSFGNARPAA